MTRIKGWNLFQQSIVRPPSFRCRRRRPWTPFPPSISPVQDSAPLSRSSSRYSIGVRRRIQGANHRSLKGPGWFACCRRCAKDSGRRPRQSRLSEALLRRCLPRPGSASFEVRDICVVNPRYVTGEDSRHYHHRHAITLRLRLRSRQFQRRRASPSPSREFQKPQAFQFGFHPLRHHQMRRCPFRVGHTRPRQRPPFP